MNISITLHPIAQENAIPDIPKIGARIKVATVLIEA